MLWNPLPIRHSAMLLSAKQYWVSVARSVAPCLHRPEFVFLLVLSLASVGATCCIANANVLKRNVLQGGESCMWSPHFDSANFMTEAFPRAVRKFHLISSEMTLVER